MREYLPRKSQMKEIEVLGELVPEYLICENKEWLHIVGVNEGDCAECDKYVMSCDVCEAEAGQPHCNCGECDCGEESKMTIKKAWCNWCGEEYETSLWHTHTCKEDTKE